MEVLQELKADNPKYVALDTETEGVEYEDKAFVLTCAWLCGETIKSAYIDITETPELAESVVEAVDTAIFHNAKFDIQKLQISGVLNRKLPFEDTEGMAHLLDEHRPKRLKFLVKHVLGIETLEEEELKKALRKLKIKKADGYRNVPREILEPYAVKDAEYTLQLFYHFLPQIEAHEDLFGLYQREKELTWTLLDIEAAGMQIDREYTSTTLRKYNSERLKLELRIRDLAGREDFNPNSNPQIKDYFENKGIVRDKYDKQVMLGITDPMAETILALRKVSKMAKTYLSAMLFESVLSKSKESVEQFILHPHFRQYLPVTGRMSSGKAES